MSKESETRTPPCDAPPRYKRALLTFAGLLGPVYIIPPALEALIPWRARALTPFAVGCIVVLMTYVIMPVLHRVFEPWLRSRQ